MSVIICTPITASAETVSGKCGDNLTWNYDIDTTILTISGSGDMYDYSVENYSGTYATSAPWGSYYSSIKNVVIEDGVTSIGSLAFYGCTGLTSVTIGNSVTSIGNFAFDGCSNLQYNVYDNAKYLGNNENPYLVLVKASSTSITSCVIYSNTRFIYDSAFNGCTGLTSITIPNSVTSIGGCAFYICTGLESVTIGNSVTSIGNYAFYGCTGLISITIPDSVTSIGNMALYNCNGLTSVTIGNGVKSIGDWTFYFCAGLTKVNYTGTIADWCKISFSTCFSNPLCYAGHLYISNEEVSNLVIPNSVTSIGNSAFFGCDGLTSVEIPNSVTSIGDEAFSYCTGLTSIEIPDSVTSIGSSAFSNCTDLTSITIPNSVTSIEYEAFCDCTGLTSITIPNSVTSIGDYAFLGCTGLEAVIYCGTESQWYIITIGDDNTDLTNATMQYHNYQTVWSADGNNHWHECSVCKDKTDVATHTFDENEVCTVCKHGAISPGDVNGDGVIDSKDLVRLKKYLAGQSVKLGA